MKIKKIATRGWRAVKPKRLAEAVAVILATIAIFAAAHNYATATRGYEAIGGEHLLLPAIPAAYCILRAAVVGAIHSFERRRFTAYYETLNWKEVKEYMLKRAAKCRLADTERRYNTDQLLAGTAKLSGVMAEVGISSEAAAAAFAELNKATTVEVVNPLHIAFLGPNIRIVDFAYRQFIEDNSLWGGFLERRRPTTLHDGTRIIPINAQAIREALHRRFDQIIIVSSTGGRFDAEMAGAINELKHRATGRVPEEYFMQFYDIDALLDQGERCDCTEDKPSTPAMQRAAAEVARITPPERAHHLPPSAHLGKPGKKTQER